MGSRGGEIGFTSLVQFHYSTSAHGGQSLPMGWTYWLWQSPIGKQAVPDWASMLRWIWSISECNLKTAQKGYLLRSLISWYNPSQAFTTKHVSYPQQYAALTEIYVGYMEALDTLTHFHGPYWLFQERVEGKLGNIWEKKQSLNSAGYWPKPGNIGNKSLPSWLAKVADSPQNCIDI